MPKSEKRTDTSFVHGKNSLAIANSCIVLGDNITGTSANHSYVESLNIKTVGSSPFVNQLRIDANGYLTTNTSDIRLKEEIKPIEDALSKIKALDGVSYKWKDRYAGGDDEKLGFIAQQVEKVDSRLVFTDKISGIKGVHIDEIIPLLVEAVKELCNDEISGKTFIETQSIVAEDNNIELNYGGNKTSSINGGIRVLHGIDEGKSADLLINERGQWFTNNDFVANGLIIPEFTPLNSNDEKGEVGYMSYDENFIYIKTKNGWKRSGFESF